MQNNKYNGPLYSTKLFTDVWNNVTDFLTDYADSGIPALIPQTGNASATTLYYLLYARHGNDPIANMDQFQWKTKLFGIIYQYGPTWIKEMDIQNTLRNMTDSDIKKGAFSMYNHALNPEISPTTGGESELTYINEQNTNRYTKGNLDAYTQYEMLIKQDVTQEFITKFDKLFKKFVYPERPVIYDSEEEDTDI